nr:carbohydrate ABC transporter permease [Clostridia bacterium]
MESRALLTRQDRAVHFVLYALLVLCMIVCAYPVYFVFIASFSSPSAANSGEMLIFPKQFHLEGYKFVLSDDRIATGYLNTVLYTACGTLLGLAASLLAGYSLSRRDLPWRNLIMALYVFTMYFSGGLVPTYLVARKLNLVNTRWIMIILGSVSVYNIILIRTFFSSSIPTELQEAAFIDGCSNLRFFLQFVLPLSSAIISVIALYLAVG